MGQSNFFKWFGMGGLPESVRASLQSESPILFLEGHRAWLRRNGTLPGGYLSGGGISSATGSFAITDRRVVVAYGKNLLADERLPTQPGPAKAKLAADGIRYEVDLAAAVPDGTGRIELHIKAKLAPDLLAKLPPEIPLPCTPELAIKLFRKFF